MSNKTIENYVVTAGVADGIVSEEGKEGDVMETTSNETVAHSAVAGIVTAGADTGVAVAEVVDAEVLDQQEPIVVRGIFQFVINKDDDAEKVKSMMQNFTEEIISAIDSFKRHPVVPIQQYAKTAHAAAYIDVDPSFLTKRQGKVFQLGKHFFKPGGESIVRWNLEALDKWIISEVELNIPIDDELASLLERS